MQRLADIAGEPRFGMLTTMRDYARSHLANSGEHEAIQCRHGIYYLEVAERARTMIDGPDQAEWLARLTIEHDNLRIVFARAIDTGDADTALRLGAALGTFWGQRGRLAEWRCNLEQALALPAHVDMAVRASALYALGRLTLGLHDFGSARRHFTACLAMWQEVHDQDGIARAIDGLGLVARELGDCATAGERFSEALAIWSASADTPGIAQALYNLGTVATARGRYDAAQALHDKALAMRRRYGNLDGVAYTLCALATVARLSGNAAAAKTLNEESQSIFKHLGDRQGEIHALHGLARVARQTGGDFKALRLFRETLALCRESGESNGVIECVEGVAAVIARRGQTEQAVALLGAAAALREKSGKAPTMAERHEEEETLAISRPNLTDGAFAEAWATGQGMSPEQAATEAMRATETLAITSRLTTPFTLTPREQDVLYLLSLHLTDPEIASRLSLSPRTASNHVARILSKLGASSRREAAGLAAHYGIV